MRAAAAVLTLLLPGGRMRSRSLALRAALLGFALAWAGPAAAQTADCSASKLQAGGRYFQGRASCLAKALAKGLEPDALCLAKTLTKLETAFAKAEAKGPCVSLADLSPIEDVLADALDEGFDALATVGATCCDGTNDVCTYQSAQSCMDAGGTPGAAGTVCQADGTCGPFPNAATGTCCDGIGDLIPNLDASCVSGPDVVAACVGEGFPLVPDATCHPELGCVLASEPVRTRCTSGKMKALGRFLAAVANCHAKSLKKEEPVELLCLGKAESKLQKAFASAEKKDDCLARNDATAALDALNDARDLLVRIVDPETTFCCQGASTCMYTRTGPECTMLAGTPVAGECNGDGTCKAPPLEEGGCCQGLTIGAKERCVGGITSLQCSGLSGEYVDDALCLAGQICID
jgi:hypothetical protein